MHQGCRGLTSRQSQRRDLSRIVLAHAPRQVPAWLIFDVGRIRSAGAIHVQGSSKNDKPRGAHPWCARESFGDSGSGLVEVAERIVLLREVGPGGLQASQLTANASAGTTSVHRSRVRRLTLVLHAGHTSQPVARANAGICHGSCWRTLRASSRRGSSLTLGKT